TTVRNIAGPYRVARHNLYAAAEGDGAPAAGYSQGQSIESVQKLAAETLPDGFSYERSTLAFRQGRCGNNALAAIALSLAIVWLVDAAQSESVPRPVAVSMRVPMCHVGAISGVMLRGQDNNILSQVGFVVLIGLAAKNATLIEVFAMQHEDQVRDPFASAVAA